MEESASNISGKTSILLSRNDPIAVVVGAAGFLGSFLAEELLKIGIQVIGVDNLTTSRKENLTDAFKHKNFHFLHQSIEDDSVEENLGDLPHLDYAIFIAENPTTSSLYKNGLYNFLKIVQRFKKGEDNSKTERPKVVFVSSIQIYDSSPEANLNYLKSAENQFAKFIKNHSLNGRIVRLSEVYGPRMHFRENQPISRLVKASLERKLAKEETALDFSSRSLFITDAISLILKSILSGSTSGKIYDGCLISPIKVEEIKQVLLNPEWHMQQNFSHTLLPPWPTPNLDRSVKELAWKPKHHIAKGLKQTIDFFNEDQEAREFALNQKKEIEKEKIKGWSFSNLEKGEEKSKNRKSQKGFFANFFWLIMLMIVLLGIFYPLLSFIVGAYSLPASINSSKEALGRGDLDGARRFLEYAKISNQQMNNLQPIAHALDNSGLIGDSSRQISNLLNAQNEGIEGIKENLDAIEQGRKIINQGQGSLNSKQFLSAQTHLSNALTMLANSDLKNSWLIPNKSQLTDDANYQYFYDLAQKGLGVSSILPKLFDGQEKTYLLLVTDSAFLQPPAGKLTQIGEIKFQKGGVLVQNLKATAQYDQELIDKNILLSQNNINSKAQFNTLTGADFPSFAQTAKVLYQSLNQKPVEGVILINDAALSNLEQAIGYQVNNDPSLSQLFQSALNEQNFLKSIQIFDQALNQKKMLIYSNDNNIQNSLANLNWTGSIKAPVKEGISTDFLAVFENNYRKANNDQIKRKFLLQTAIGQDGGLSHVLTINYDNIQTQVYHSTLQLLLPLGSKLTQVKVGESVASFTGTVDFGRAVYSGEININKGTTPVIFEYNLAKKVEVGEQGGNYLLKINKQPGTADEQLDWQLNYPFSWDLVSKVKGVDTTKRQINIQTILDADKSFDFSFKKH